MIKQSSTSKYSNINLTCSTDKPQSLKNPNSLENGSKNLKKKHFSLSNLSTQVGKDKIEDSDETTLHRLSTSMQNVVNISLVSSSSGYFVDVKSHKIESDTVNAVRRR